ncbi:MAG: tetratricopeptide repeat protein [Steroidobacteraceae bacterium]
MMPDPSRSMSALRFAVLVVLATVAVACPTQSAIGAAATAADKPAASTAGKGESELLMAAEQALRNGNCRAATENYVAAAQLSTEVPLARRATQLALACDQLGAARVAVARWRALDKYSGEAALAAALVAFKRYDLPEARTALIAWRESGVGGSQDPLGFAELLQQQADVTAVYRLFGEVLVNDDSTAEVQLALARLAFAAQNMNVAMAAARRAQAIDPNLLETQIILLRAMSIQGEHNAAIAGARTLDAAQLQGDDVFLLADLLTAAERTQDAQAELQRLATQNETRQGAVRRLLTMALRESNRESAEQLLGLMLTEPESTVLAVFYFAQMAEQRGDDERAMQAYRELADSPLGLTARKAAARLMLKHGERKGALTVLDDYVKQHPDAALEVGATRAQLLVQAGDVDAALQGLDALASDYPDHPDLVYQRATVLEAGGRTRAAIAQFEQGLKQRPADPQLQNALGFTLADHKQELPRAEQLIRAALAVSPDSAAIQDSLGWVLFQRGKAKAALPVLARAWQNSGDSEIGAHYGEVLWRAGDQAQARYIWQQALNSSPAHEHLLGTMKRLTGEDAAKP